MSLPKIATRQEWLAARTDLLAREKELTRQRDALNAERRDLPMVEIEKDYVFDGPDGPARLADLFEGRPQLIVYHFMFDPEWEDGCSSCTAGTDELSAGFFEHLHARDTSYAMVSRAPLAKLERWKAKKGWDVPWYSSFGTDFNYDFGVTIDDSVAPSEYNFRAKAEYEAQGEDLPLSAGKRSGSSPPDAASPRDRPCPTSRPDRRRQGSGGEDVAAISATSALVRRPSHQNSTPITMKHSTGTSSVSR
jgi:predicted dithiol-disulfide oxidoreductase (DUF899 family)